MQTKLERLFYTSPECKEKTHPCKIAKSDVRSIYKPDDGIKISSLEYKLFTNHPPKLCDCAIVYDKNRLALVEIKCGKVTISLYKDVVEKLENTAKLITHEGLKVSKYILLYKQFENTQIKKVLATKKIRGLPLISKKYENKALAI